MNESLVLTALDEALQARLRVWPARGQERERVLESLEKLTSCIEEMIGLNESVMAGDSIRSSRDNDHRDSSRWANKPIIVCGPMKSGTTLLLNLLDNHSSLIALPGDSWLRWWLGDDSANRRPRTRHDCLLYWLRRLIVPTGQEPIWLLGRDIEQYLHFSERYLGMCTSCTPGSLEWFLSGVEALVCEKKWTTANRLVEKTPGNEYKMKFYKQAFHEVQFVMMVRNPYSIAASIKMLCKLQGWGWDCKATASEISKSMKIACEHFHNPQRQVHVVQYESLTNNVTEEMSKTAVFLGIPVENTLFHPTVLGMPASSNSMIVNQRNCSEVYKSQSRDEKNREVLSRHERVMIHAIAGEMMEVFGYPEI